MKVHCKLESADVQELSLDIIMDIMRVAADKMTQDGHYWYSLAVIYLSYFALLYVDQSMVKIDKESEKSNTIHCKEKELIYKSNIDEIQMLKKKIEDKDAELHLLNKEIVKKNNDIVMWLDRTNSTSYCTTTKCTKVMQLPEKLFSNKSTDNLNTIQQEANKIDMLLKQAEVSAENNFSTFKQLAKTIKHKKSTVISNIGPT